MGKSVPKGLKSKAEFLLSEYPDKFSADFEQNKSVVRQLGVPLTAVNRNIMVGFITRQQKRKESA